MLALETSAEFAKAELVLLLVILMHGMVTNNDVYAGKNVTEAARRRLISPKRRVWPNATIPYVIDCSIANVIGAKHIIRAAMAEWEKRTCVRFVKRTNQQGYLLIRRHRGCWGDVGYRPSRVTLSMGDGCEHDYVMLHELGHIIGFHHEHQRHDRDSFIEILWDNVMNSMLRQFLKRRKMDKFDGKLPYDYSSIMHYKFGAFAKNRSLNTIEVRTEPSTENGALNTNQARDEHSRKRYTPYSYITDMDVRKTAELYNCSIDESQLRGTTYVAPRRLTLKPKVKQKKTGRKPAVHSTEKPKTKVQIEPTTALELGVKLSVKSAGWYSGKERRVNILVNGSEYSTNSWGMNVVLISYNSGRRTRSSSYRISRKKKAKAFARVLRRLPKRHYVIIVSKTDMLDNLKEAKREIEALGGYIPRRFRRGTAYCLIGYNGDEKVHVKQILGDPKEVLSFSMTLQLAKDYRCQDDTTGCESRIRDCRRYPKYFLRVCQKSCGVCKPDRPCEDENEFCSQWAKENNCDKHPKYMLKKCRVSCGICWKALPPVVEKPRRTGTKLLKQLKQAAARTYGERQGHYDNEQDNDGLLNHFKQLAARTYGENREDDDDDEDNDGPTGIKCVDKSRNCPSWERHNRCKTDSWVKKNCLISCYKTRRRSICDKEQIRPEGSCFRPLGLGWNRRLPDHSFTSSSVLALKGNWSAGADNGRLYMEDDHKKLRIGGWCARSPPKDGKEWLKIDLIKIRKVRAVATQGRFRFYEHVTRFRLSSSKDGKRWYDYKEGRRIKVFDGNCDHQTPVLNILPKPVLARYVRFHPIKFYGAICMRVEIFGCRLNERT